MSPPRVLNVSLFPTKSTAGIELATDICRLLEAYGETSVTVFDRSKHDVTMQIVVMATLTQDLVVFDATREPNMNNFDIANDGLKLLPHVIVVSRNYLPVNFSGFYDDFYPSYVEEKKANREIMATFEERLETLLALKPHVDKAIVHYRDRIEMQTDRLRKLRRERTGVFISYRTKYATDSIQVFPGSFQYSASDLARRVREGKYGKSRPASFLENGDLVYENEVLTEQRRWELLGQIDSGWIRDRDEFWIYGAPDHFDSWWTIGEFAVFLNCMQQIGQRKCLRIYSPNHDIVTDVDIEALPRLSPMDVSHLAHRFMLQSPTMLTPHLRTARVARILAEFSRRTVVKPLVRLLLRPVYRVACKHGGVPRGVGFDEFAEIMVSKYYHDCVLGRPGTRDYWEQPELFFARTSGAKEGRPNGSCVLPLKFNRLFDFAGFERFAITREDIDRGVLTAAGRRFVLRHEKPRFIFAHSYGGRDYSSTGENLEVLPVIRFWESNE